MKLKLHYCISVLLILLFSSTLSKAQTNICTNHPPTGNANYTVLFNVANTNTYGIQVMSIDANVFGGAAGTYTFTLLYNPAEVNSSGSTWTQGTVEDGQNGWVQAGTATITLGAVTGPTTVISGMSVIIPSNDTFGFALTCDATLEYSALTTTGVNSFTTGGVSILTGDNISWGAPALPATPASYPRGFIGCIGFQSTVPCSGPPTPGTASASPAAVCPNATSTLSVTGATSGFGITYQWESSPAGQNTWSTINGATNATYSATISANTDFRRNTICSANSAASAPVTLALNAANQCYCTPTVNSQDELLINVAVANLNNASSGFGNQGYEDFTGDTVNLVMGVPYPFSADIDPFYNDDLVAVWVDVDQDGVFANPGERFVLTQSVTPATGMLTIPMNATPGYTRMRVRLDYNNTNPAPCGSSSFGNTEDYIANLIVPPPCNGTPVSGTAYAPATVCSGADFVLTDTAFEIGTGITYQWESSPAGVGIWSPINGATTTIYTLVGGITTPTDFRMVTTCANGGATNTTTDISVGMSPFYLCYCGPATGISLNDYPEADLTNVSILNGSLNNSTTQLSPNSYTLFYPTTPTTTDSFYQGQQYTINLTHQYTGIYSTAWIDYDGDGVFSSSESIAITTASGGNSQNASATFIVPLTATPGLTGLRVRTYYQNLGSGDACTQFSDYETEDYVVSILVTPPCNGIPVAGTASGPASICPNADFNLLTSGYTVGQNITIQWESSPAGAGTWTPIAGATNPVFTMSGGISAATDFHMVITCGNGNGTDISNIVTVGVNPFYLCYCGPNTGLVLNSYFDNYIENVNITNGYLNNTTSAPGNDGYSLFWPSTTSTTDTLYQGQIYTLNTTHLYTGYFSTAWLDMDGDGVFSSNESIALTTSNGGNGIGATGTFFVPFTATPGLTGLRVRTSYFTLGASDACLPYDSYETEDYVVSIIAPPGCVGTPVAGTASAPASVCSGADFNLSLNGYSVASSISIQWEGSPAGVGIWTPLSGATDPFYTVVGGITTPTDFRAVVTCGNGGATDISNTVAITINPFYACYCESYATNTGDEEILNVTVASMNNSSTCSTTGGAGSMVNQYSNYTATVTPASVSQGQTVSFSIDANTCGGNYDNGTAIFIDLDQSGTFDPGEQVFATPGVTNGPNMVTGTFIMPITAAVGTTGMRVVLAEGYNGVDIDPCMTYGYGETEDYAITITAAVPCNGMPNAGTAFGPASVCSGVDFVLTDTAYTVASGMTFQWESSPAGQNTWTTVSGATSPVYTVVGGTATAIDYRLVVTCVATAQSANSNTVSMTIAPFYQCYCAPPATVLHNFVDNFITNVTMASTTLNSSNGTNTATGYTLVPPTPSFNTASMAPGQSYNLVCTVNSATGTPLQAAAWIDFDESGTFDASEYTALTINTTTVTGTIAVPAGATLGSTGMRLRFRGGNFTSSDACLAFGSGETEDYTVTIATPPACAQPFGLAVTNVGNGTADISWTAVSGAGGYEYAITASSTPPSTGTAATNAAVTGATFTPGSQSYYLHVRTDCGGSGFSAWSTFAFIANDEASGAVLLTVGGGCTGNPYTNATATQSANEVYPSCNDAGTGVSTVWFKFVAPASGAVRVSTDNSPQGTLLDSKVGLFSATNVNNYSTFNIISCDEDGGVVGSGYNSILYATGLTSGTTYYVEVDVFDAFTSGGTFCVTVDELNSSMIASGSLSCATGQTPQMAVSTYTGWIPLLTNTGQLIALVRNSGGATGGDFEPDLTINSGAVRQVGNQYYLDRNYKINNANITTPTDVQLFFLNSEMTALQGVDPAATLSNLNVTKQSGTNCEATYVAANGTNTALLQSGNGTINGASWIQVSTSSFSNFYIMSGAWPLAIKLRDISATNVGARNRVDWNTESELKGDRFEVERSVDGNNFTYMATVNAKGEASAYSYWDEQPVTGVNYYRLKMTDASGKFAYSRTVRATVKEGSFTVEAYPNPVSDVLTVKAYGTSSVNATVTISDAAGKVVKIVTVVNGMAKVNMGGLAQGIYQVKYSDNNHTQTIKVSKQ